MRFAEVSSLKLIIVGTVKTEGVAISLIFAFGQSIVLGSQTLRTAHLSLTTTKN